jgi:hypothetical protein
VGTLAAVPGIEVLEVGSAACISLPATELDVRPIGAGEGDDFADVVVAGYEMPHALRAARARFSRHASFVRATSASRRSSPRPA